MTPLVSVIVVTWNRKSMVLDTLDSICSINYPNLEVIVVDNASSDGTPEAISKLFPQVRLVCNSENLMASGGCNAGIRHARGAFLFRVDDDNVLDEGIVAELVKVAEEDVSIGVLGPKMYFYDDPRRIWCAGCSFNFVTSRAVFHYGFELDEGQCDGVRDVDCFPNAFMIRREAIDRVGMFDSEVFPHHEEELDLCVRARKAGFRVVFVPKAKLWHRVPLPRRHLPGTSGDFNLDNEGRAFVTARSRILVMKKHAPRFYYWLFAGLFLPVVTAVYLMAIMKEHKSQKRWKVMGSYLRGTLKGLVKKVPRWEVPAQE